MAEHEEEKKPFKWDDLFDQPPYYGIIGILLVVGAIAAYAYFF